jgi:hypothetical protein
LAQKRPAPVTKRQSVQPLTGNLPIQIAGRTTKKPSMRPAKHGFGCLLASGYDVACDEGKTLLCGRTD